MDHEGRQEAIAPSMHGLNEARVLRVVSERLAQEAHRFRERRVSDVRVLPHGLMQFLPGDDLAGTAQEQLEYGQHTRREWNLDLVAREQPILRIEGKRAEVDDARPGLEDGDVEHQPGS